MTACRVALLCALLAFPVATARAEPAPKPTPQKLWQTFPLDSTPHHQQPASAPTARPPAAQRNSGGSSLWIWIAAVAAIAAVVAALLVATSVPARIRRRTRSRRDVERGATDVLDDLIEVLRAPFQRRRLNALAHPFGRSTRPDEESRRGLVTLNAWLSGTGGDSAENEAELLKAKLVAHEDTGVQKPEERSPDEDVDLLKAKLQDQAAQAKPAKTSLTSDEALAAKPRTKADAEKYAPRPQQKTAAAPSLVVLPSKSSGAKAPRRAEPQRRGTDDACTISYWRGYVKSRFYAADDGGYVVAESRLFRSRGEEPAESDDAVAAHQELVAQLEDDAWVPAGKGDRWYELRFRRTAAPAGHTPSKARHEREEHHV